MANNMSSRQACHAARYVVARVLRGLFWCLKYTVILPLATMALMALFVLWKDNTTPGQLLVQEIDFVRQTAPAGQFPVRECLPSLHDLPGAEEKICRYRAADAADGTVAKLAMRQPFVLFKGLTFQKLCLPGAFRPGDHHNK
ncbi:conjugal transfer protein TraP, partial [Escherichia coli]|nr:conjugal transfer protein TraP [Escherichia coli]MDL7621247.1 conjugal transfer protein TraP [Escherichia coli]MDL7665254.1 conjugal transfer protein TraP [Escherichia coli]MDL7784708.1 conjugal transfer protein TraP [Escherichia coli]MDL7947074.1 conjugal transfer protein TraP [Escherichia coli]